MKNKEIIKILENNPESKFTISISDGVSQGKCNHIVDVSDSENETVVLGGLDKLTFFHPTSKKRISDLIRETGLMPNDDVIDKVSENIVNGLYAGGGIVNDTIVTNEIIKDSVDLTRTAP